jgi:hypothetical protein
MKKCLLGIVAALFGTAALAGPDAPPSTRTDQPTIPAVRFSNEIATLIFP